MTTGRIDVHSHLLPGIDDGCKNVAESVACAKLMVQAGYTHSFCTPHVWPHLSRNTVSHIPRYTEELQSALDMAGVKLRLIPGGELNLREDMHATPDDGLVSYGMRRRFVLIDLWCDTLPRFFQKGMEWLQSRGVTVILAHPERMAAVQKEPDLADYFAKMELLLQGNLQCFSDPLGSPTRRTAERFLLDGRYFLLGSDLHNLASLPMRLEGLNRATDLVGPETVDVLTVTNPAQLL